LSNKSRIRIESSVFQQAEEIAASRGLSSATVIDAALRVGLGEIGSAQRYDLLPTGILLVRDRSQDAPPASRRKQKASTPKPKADRDKTGMRAIPEPAAGPLTATTSQTQPQATQPTPHPAQQAPEAATGPLTAATPQTTAKETDGYLRSLFVQGAISCSAL
jgi:hypothetical protein